MVDVDSEGQCGTGGKAKWRLLEREKAGRRLERSSRELLIFRMLLDLRRGAGGNWTVFRATDAHTERRGSTWQRLIYAKMTCSAAILDKWADACLLEIQIPLTRIRSTWRLQSCK